MATRGRKSNRLYVDTANDPKGTRRYGQNADAEPIDVLRCAIAVSSVDTSATQTQRLENDAAWATWRPFARGAEFGRASPSVAERSA